MSDEVDLLICGAGPVGCVIAEQAANVLGWRVLLIDRRPHLAGNCHDAPHANGVLIHRYGPHYFRTNSPSLVRYLSQFTEWTPALYEVKSLVHGKLFPFPINLTTLEQYFSRTLDPESAANLLAERQSPSKQPRDSEEYVLSRVGKELYESFYRGYTLKQWGMHPRDLSPEVCGRIPVRLNRDKRYVDHRYQMMPSRGFTPMFAQMIRHPRIRLLLNCDYQEIRGHIRPVHATVYTGPIDAYFGHRFGQLPYRSLRFAFVPFATEYVQPCVQINYPNDHHYTRSVEIKHVTGQRHPETVVSFEYPETAGEPYYPVPTPTNKALYERYRLAAEDETRKRRVYFCGRLAQYRYFNTDEAILEALSCFDRIRKHLAPDRSSSGCNQPGEEVSLT